MIIDSLIDKSYISFCVLEEMFEVLNWLRDSPYLVAIDEEMEVAGIVTLADIKAGVVSIKDCNLYKPAVSPRQSLVEVIALMKSTKLDYLPVHDHGAFIGVISRERINERLVQLLNHHRLCLKNFYNMNKVQEASNGDLFSFCSS